MVTVINASIHTARMEKQLTLLVFNKHMDAVFSEDLRMSVVKANLNAG